MPKRNVGAASKRRQTVEEQIALAKAITLAFGGSVAPHVK